MEEVAASIKYVDVPVSGTTDVVVFIRVLQGKGYEKFSIDVVDAKRRVTGWQIGIRKRACQADLLVIGIEGIDLAIVEIRCIDEVRAPAVARGEPFKRPRWNQNNRP